MSKGASGKRMPLSVCVPATTTNDRDLDDAPGLSASDPSPVVGGVALPAMGRVETIQLSSPPRSGQLSPASPRMIAFEDLGSYLYECKVYILKCAILSTYGQLNNNYKQFRSKLGSNSFILYITTINIILLQIASRADTR